MSKHSSVGEKVGIGILIGVAVLSVIAVLYGLLGLLAAALVSVIFSATGFDSGMSFGQLWLVSSVAVFLVQWVGKLLFGQKAVTINKS